MATSKNDLAFMDAGHLPWPSIRTNQLDETFSNKTYQDDATFLEEYQNSTKKFGASTDGPKTAKKDSEKMGFPTKRRFLLPKKG